MEHEVYKKVMFLVYESPWPAHSGGALRTMGLLRELSKAFKVELVVLSRSSLSYEQISELKKYSHTIVSVSLRIASVIDKIHILKHMLRYALPYHCATIEASFEKDPKMLRKIQCYPGIIFTDVGHWGVLTRNRHSTNWILNQCDADVEFWRIYASQTTSRLYKVGALINWWLANKHFREIYKRVGRIISVCEEDKKLTQNLCSQTQIDVIENGIDCSYYAPDRKARNGPPRILFTGTSAARNLIALGQFLRNVFPLIQKEIPQAELIAGGNFNAKAQAKFKNFRNVRFTGRLDDMRPLFNQSDVFIAPFEETHGSKLKVAEAMAMAMSIVSTPEGIRGFPLIDGESVFIAYNNEQFAEHVIRLLRNPVEREKTGALAREIALTSINWEILGIRLINIVKTTENASQYNL